MAKKPFNKTSEKSPNSAAPPPGLADLVRRLMDDSDEVESDGSTDVEIEPSPRRTYEEKMREQAAWEADMTAIRAEAATVTPEQEQEREKHAAEFRRFLEEIKDDPSYHTDMTPEEIQQ